MRYELIDEENRIFERIDENSNTRITCVEWDRDYQAWLAEQEAAKK